MNFQRVTEEVTSLFFFESCFDSGDFIHVHIHSELHVSAVSILLKRFAHSWFVQPGVA